MVTKPWAPKGPKKPKAAKPETTKPEEPAKPEPAKPEPLEAAKVPPQKKEAQTETSIDELIADAEKQTAHIDHPNADASSKAIVALLKVVKRLAAE